MKTNRQFYSLIIGLVTVLAGAVGLLLVAGDGVGQSLRAQLEYLPEGAGGLPQIGLTFEGNKLPERAAVEAAFEVRPNLSGDFSWNGATLLFTPAVALPGNTEYVVRLRGGLKLVNGGRLSYGQTVWSFRTRPTRIAFLRHEGQAINLWLDEQNGQPPRRLTTETERQVMDYTISPGGERVVYSLQEANGQEAGLWLVQVSGGQPRKLVYATNIKATAPRWSPGGDLIAYERRLVFNGGGFSPAQLWLVRPDGTSLPPLYGGAERTGVGVAWTGWGEKVFFWEPQREALGSFNFSGEPKWKSLPGVKLESFAPSPDGRELMIARYDYSGTTERQILERLSAGPDGNWETNSLQVAAQVSYNDRSPAWSSDGKLMAFLRQSGRTPKSGHLWLFDPSSGNSHPLIEEEGEKRVNHGAYQWSQDGHKLLFERYPAGTRPPGIFGSDEESEIWEVNQDGSNARQLVARGFAARWIN